MIGQHVTGTNDHEDGIQLRHADTGQILLDRVAKRKGKSASFKLFQTIGKSEYRSRFDPSALGSLAGQWGDLYGCS